jgi:hypothetical protein
MQAGGNCPRRPPTTIQKLTHTGFDGDRSQHAMPAGEPAPHSDVRAILRAYRSESFLGPQQIFFQAARPPSFLFS